SKRTFSRALATSVKCQKRTFCRYGRDRRYSITSSARERSVAGTSKPIAFAVPEVDDKFVLGRRLDRQIGRLLASEDTINIAGRASAEVVVVRSVGHQATVGGVIRAIVDGGQLVLGCQRYDQLAMHRRPHAAGHDQSAVRTLREGSNCALDLAGIAHIYRTQLHTKRWCLALLRGARGGPRRYSRISEDGRSRHAGRDLFEQLEPFPAHGKFEAGKASYAPTRPCQTLDIAGADRIGDGRENDRKSAGRLQQGRHRVGAISHDDVRPEPHQLHRLFTKIRSASAAPKRVSMRTLRPPTQPSCCSPCKNAAKCA